MIMRLYGMLKKSKLFAGFIGSIEKRFSILYPSSKEENIRKTIKLFIKLAIIDFAIILFICLLDFKVYYAVMAGMLVYIISGGYIKKSFYKAETELLIMQERFISTLRYKYQLCPIIEEAFRDTLDETENMMQQHGQLLLDHMIKEGLYNGSEYSETAPNGYFMTLYALCNTVRNYGDKKGEKGSVFTENLGYLKEEIHIELLRRKKINSVFSGLFTTAILPVFAIKPIEVWAEFNIPEITVQFESASGRLITFMLCVISVLVYAVISALKYSFKSGNNIKSRWVSLADRGIVESLILKYMALNYKKSMRLNNRLKEMVYTYNVKEFLFRRIVFTAVSFVLGVITCMSIGISWLFSFVAATVTYYGVYLWLLIRENIMKLEREEEVMRFQNIILMIMNTDRINIPMILEQMEVFASAFKSKVQYLIDEYPYEGINVFETVKNECGFRPFERLMESFIACDSMSISRAFDDVKSDRQYYVEKHKQDNEIIIENKGAVGKLLAFIPLYGVVIMKLIVPFVAEGLKMMSSSGL